VSALTATAFPGPDTAVPRRSLEGVSSASKAIRDQRLAAQRHAGEPVTRRPLGQRFAELAATWQEERGYSSSLKDMVLSPSYQRVIALGRPVVPYILAELARKPDHWFWALTTITGVNPIAHEVAGHLRAMTEAWIRWGDEEGLVD
jgi:hypothetical protein